LIPSRHRLSLIDDRLRQRVLEARLLFAAELPGRLRGAVEFFHPVRIDRAATLQDNILFGKVRYGQEWVMDLVQALIVGLGDEVGLRPTVIAVGLVLPVGVAGARLSSAQRQKVALVRALLRRPELLVLNEAISALDGGAQL